MIKTIFKMSTGENVYIYDDVFNNWEAYNIQTIVEKSLYRLGSKTTNSINSRETSFFQSKYSQQDMELLNLTKNKNFLQILTDHVEPSSKTNTWVNVTTHLTDYKFHVDYDCEGGVSLLYYVNQVWENNWGGETIFKNSNNETEIAVAFRPNRVVIFDSRIGHKPANISITSDLYRFTLVTQFKPRDEK